MSGIPYMGNKSSIAKSLVNFILYQNPNIKYVYDLFGGGASMSYEFARRGLQVHYNDLNTGVCELLKKIQSDGVTDEFCKWVSREEFELCKNRDDWRGGFVKTCWSFGNNSKKGYLYGDYLEANKKLGHDYCFHGVPIPGIPDTDKTNKTERRLFLNSYCKKEFAKLINSEPGLKENYKKYCSIIESKYTKDVMLDFTRRLRSTGITAKQVNEATQSQMSSHYLTAGSQPAIPTKEQQERLVPIIPGEIPQRVKELFSVDEAYKKEQIKQLGDVQRLERLERLESLQNLERLERLSQGHHNFTITNLSYEQVPLITPIDETIVYLDPPYLNTAKYQEGVDHQALHQWIFDCPYKVYVSSYEWEGLREVFSVEKRSLLSSKGTGEIKQEKLFVNF